MLVGFITSQSDERDQTAFVQKVYRACLPAIEYIVDREKLREICLAELVEKRSGECNALRNVALDAIIDASPYLREIAKGSIEKAKEGVRQLYQLFLTRAERGYTDHRQSLRKNYGFADGRAVQLDVGRIKLDERVKKMPLNDLERIVANLSEQLPPALAPVLNECLEESKGLQ